MWAVTSADPHRHMAEGYVRTPAVAAVLRAVSDDRPTDKIL